MKKTFSKWLVGVFAFALCMCLTSTIAKAGKVQIATKRVGDDKTFNITVVTDPGEAYGDPVFDNYSAHAELIQQQGNVRVYRVSFTDSVEMNSVMNITIPGANDKTSDINKSIEVYMHDATDAELEEVFGDSNRGGGQTPTEGNPNYPGGAGGGGGSGVYGDPEDLANVLSAKGGVGEVVFDFLKLIAVILTFGALCFLGVNLMINRDKPEDRVNTMVGFKFIIIGVLLLDIVLLIYALVDGLMGNQEDEVAEFGGEAAIVRNFEEL